MTQSSLDIPKLTRELDIVKSKVFLGNNSAFYGSLLCILQFDWDTNIKTASTDGNTIWWNPDWFLTLELNTKITVLVHELNHVARLHMVRRGSRDPEQWNGACDLRINNDLTEEGYSFKGIEWGWIDASVDRNGKLSEEEIYELLQQNKIKMPANCKSEEASDLVEPTELQKSQTINNVVSAIQQSKLSPNGGAGSMTGKIEELVNKFIKPIVPWETLLMKFFTDLGEEDRTWHRPNRRHTDIYLPTTVKCEDRLEHLAYFADTSGSISNEDIIRFNSEIKYIKDVLNPSKLSLCLFDTEITKEVVYTEEDSFDSLVVVGRGGTSLEPVKEWIDDNKPTAAVIFSDLDCYPMKPLKYNIPVIWIAVNSHVKTIPFGEILHIK